MMLVLTGRLLWRNSKSGELKIIALAMILAVAMISAIGGFVDQLQATLISQSNSFLAADRQVRSSHQIDAAWQAKAQSEGLRTARTETFTSMVFGGPDQDMVLAAIKSVEQGYPLLGELTVSEQLFRPDLEVAAQGIPPLGQAWVDARLLAQLSMQVGDVLELGESQFQVTQVIVREPDRGQGFSAFAPRVIINRDDLPRTEIVQPGSRVNYRLLLAGNQSQLEGYLDWLTPQLSTHQRIIKLDDAQQGIARTLGIAKNFLLLSASIGVLLACAAIAMAARRFADRQTDAVALMKAFGASQRKVRSLYLGQLLLLTVFASIIGCIVGAFSQQAIVVAARSLAGVELLDGGYRAYGLALVTSAVALLLFALPQLWPLPTISPLKVLRRDLASKTPAVFVQLLLMITAVLLLIWLYSGNVQLSIAMAAALLAVAAAAGLLALLLMHLAKSQLLGRNSRWRLVFASLWRRRLSSLALVSVFAIAFMLLFSLFSIRTQLIADWRKQLPSDTPNHFFINIAPEELPAFKRHLDQMPMTQLYPMVRGRLVGVNGVQPDEATRARVPLLRREANISWTQTLPEANELTAGKWWSEIGGDKSQSLQVSVESSIAKSLNLALGDQLQFSFGGRDLSAEVASIRKLDWNSFKPNFYFLFEPGALDHFAPMYMTSAYLPVSEKMRLVALLKELPTVVVIEVDKIIEQIRDIIDKVSMALEVVLVLVLAAGALVLLASVNASFDARLQEVGLLRALGATGALLRQSLWLEYLLLGLVSGLIAVIGAEVLLQLLQLRVFNMPVTWHYSLWWAGPLLASAVIGVLGYGSTRASLTAPPMQVLRDAQ